MHGRPRAGSSRSRMRQAPPAHTVPILLILNDLHTVRSDSRTRKENVPTEHNINDVPNGPFYDREKAELETNQAAVSTVSSQIETILSGYETEPGETETVAEEFESENTGGTTEDIAEPLVFEDWSPVGVVAMIADAQVKLREQTIAAFKHLGLDTKKFFGE